MSLTVTLTPGHDFPDGEPVTLADLRAAASPTIAIEGAVGSTTIPDASVTTPKIAVGSVIEDRIADLAVTTFKLDNSAVTSPKISVGAVTSDKWKAGAWFYQGSPTTMAGTNPNVYTITLPANQTLASLIDGAIIAWKAPAMNTTRVDVIVDGLPQKKLLKYVNGLARLAELGVGDIREGQIVEMRYRTDGLGDWIMLSRTGNDGWRYQDIPSGVDVITVNFDPTVATLGMVKGIPLRFKAAGDNTKPVTLNADGTGAVPIKKNVNESLAPGDIKSGQIVEVVYDGTNFQLMSPTMGIIPRAAVLFDGSIEVNQFNFESDTVQQTLKRVDSQPHGFSAGQVIWAGTPGIVNDGLPQDRPFYVSILDQTYFRLARTRLDAIQGTNLSTVVLAGGITLNWWNSDPILSKYNIDGISLLEGYYTVDFTQDMPHEYWVMSGCSVQEPLSIYKSHVVCMHGEAMVAQYARIAVRTTGEELATPNRISLIFYAS